MEIDQKGRDINWMNDEYIKHADLCESFIKEIFPKIAEELWNTETVQNATIDFFNARIERGDFE